MDINLDLIKQIISSDELCMKVNSTVYKESYKKQIVKYVLYLCGDIETNISYINRYLKYFVITNKNKEDAFFDPVVLKSLEKGIHNKEYVDILKSFGFFEIKEILMKKYDQIIKSDNNSNLSKMIYFYMYICGNTVLPTNYVDYFIKKIVTNKYKFNYDMIVYLYKEFALSYSNKYGLNIKFEVRDKFIKSDPYYDSKKNEIFIYKHDIIDEINYSIISSIFSQINYLIILKSINDPDNKVYTFDQLRLVKELCLISILGEDAYNNSYSNISFSNHMHKEAYKKTKEYFSNLGIEIKDFEDITLDIEKGSIDILFDSVIKKEGVNLIKSLVKNYPVLACEYKPEKKKSILALLLDIYSNNKLLINLNKDLEWHKTKNDNEVTHDKIKKLEDRITVCKSVVSVMNDVINNGDMMLDDLLISISDLILYNTNKEYVKKDIYTVLKSIIPKKIYNMCKGHDVNYIEDVRKKIIECYLTSLNTVRENMDMDYFMKLYSTLDSINLVFEKVKTCI